MKKEVCMNCYYGRDPQKQTEKGINWDIMACYCAHYNAPIAESEDNECRYFEEPKELTDSLKQKLDDFLDKEGVTWADFMKFIHEL